MRQLTLMMIAYAATLGFGGRSARVANEPAVVTPDPETLGCPWWLD